MPDDRMQALKRARAEMRQVQAWLLAPSAETLDQCAPSLERALEALRNLRRVLASPGEAPSGLGDGLRALAREIRQTETLLRAAGDLYVGSVQSLITASGLYDETGGPTLPRPRGQLSVLG